MVRLRARYVFPVDRPPIENGLVTIEGEWIRDVGRFNGEADATDLGDVAIIPGLVNAHTHLEFSNLEKPLGEPGMSLPWWIRAVIEHRACAPGDDSRACGVKESIRWGVTTIGNIETQSSMLGSSLVNIAAYYELRAMRQAGIEASAQQARLAYSSDFAGLSPHAPYTVHQRLLEIAIELMQKRGGQLVMHLAESREELQLLQTSQGPFRDLLEERGWWEPGAIRLGARPLDYIEELSKVSRSLVIHGNYLDDEEIRCLAAYRDRMSVVYCPRTHAYFRHEPYPLSHLWEVGVRVALGTDSRASNPDLDLRQEMRYVIDHHGLAPSDALKMGTLEGARALGHLNRLGTVTNEKIADLAVLRLPNKSAADPHELLFDDDACVVAAICRGRVVFSEHPALKE
jgi:cytosine/adenosine deaminase-related metal-dependent hydrolase